MANGISPEESYRAIDFYQAENLMIHASESEEKVYEIQQQLIFELRRNVEMQLKRSLEVETLPKFADKKVAKQNKLENIDGNWFLSKLGLNLNKTQAYLMTLWQHLSPTLQKKWIPSIKDKSVALTTYLEPKIHYLTVKSIEVLYTSKQVLTPALIKGFDVSYSYLEIYGKWFLSKLGLNLNKTQTYLMTLWQQHLSLALEKKWIPSIKDASLTTYLERKLHYLSDKSIEVLYTAMRVLTPDLIQEFDVSYYYLQVNRVMTIAKLHLKKENVRRGFKKLVNSGRKKIRKVTQREVSSG
ncbi:hypothetical protein HID58_011653 [Brassica napus]|uniref:Uncharacterized protein n=1 Tax=Brassica napus TaxID=3708 RepID=A0ABQ8E1J6_BRANA|nr:hypothetical protein HID58_011653 [Brassica napus]